MSQLYVTAQVFWNSDTINWTHIKIIWISNNLSVSFPLLSTSFTVHSSQSFCYTSITKSKQLTKNNQMTQEVIPEASQRLICVCQNRHQFKLLMLTTDSKITELQW
jgi:hypothetical protein